jgi:hypothetical protein
MSATICELTDATRSEGTAVDEGAEQLATPRQERRSQRRAQVKLSARICPVDATSGIGWEVIATMNATRQSLYFVTDSEWYHVGLRIRVTFPFDPARDSLSILGDLGEVTRAERLPGGRVGVAILLRKWTGAAQSARLAATERRTVTRHPFVAEAIVIDSQSKSRLQARCSDLSLQGCYVDTMNPLPYGSVTRVELRTVRGVLEAVATVNSSHVGMGMGLCFQNLTPGQTATLVDWIGTEPCERMWVPPAVPSEKDEAADRTLAKNLVRDLLAKRVLTREDVSEILFGPPII